jgi:hypothetical protein
MNCVFYWDSATKNIAMGDSSYRLNFDQGKKNEIQNHSLTGAARKSVLQ